MRLIAVVLLALLAIGTVEADDTGGAWVARKDNPALPVNPPPNRYHVAHGDPCVVLDPHAPSEARYKMYFGSCEEGGTTRTGIAISADGDRWRVDTSVSTNGKEGIVLDLGPEEAWDSSRAESVCVIVVPGAPAARRYEMWYSGAGPMDFGDGEKHTIYQLGHAWSADGRQWERDPANPVVRASEFDWQRRDPGYAGMGDPCVVRLDDAPEDRRYMMWFTAAYGRQTEKDTAYCIRVATSPDGSTWTQRGIALDVSDGAWDARVVAMPCVVGEGGSFGMWYAGATLAEDLERAQIGCATSIDGLRFEKAAHNPVLTILQASWGSDFDHLWGPHVLVEGGGARMWFSGGSLETGITIGGAERR
ncbi:MAG: hypothetical protein HY720_05595 [Planctomycetes bacterium]|nr:hypothetical protein [Planctomycetota bacterium]